jgi:predicted transposase YbfD/YdcC
MHLTPLSLEVPPLDLPIVFDFGIIYHQFQTLADTRKRRGVRYPLAVLLTIAVMAKLAGSSGARAIADWAALRAELLAELFDLPRPRMPHLTTWTRVFAHAVILEAFEQSVAQISAPASTAEVPARGSLQVCLDGKTLRGTIPLGERSGVHLLAAYHAEQGVVLAQVAVDAKANEIVMAPQLLDQLDLTGVVVSGDAMFAQRRLSTQIVEAGGDYFWWVKDNQPSLLVDLELLFTDEYVCAGWSAPPVDFTSAATIEKGHGRLEQRVLTASSLLADYHDWPYVAQVVKVERTRTTKLKQTHEVAYGITSLPAAHADAARLLALGRGHWRIENGLHYRRDVTLQEDASQLRRGHAPQVVAALNNLVCGLCGRAGISNLAAVQRICARRIDQWLEQQRM